jgi:hypothetical protein
MGIWPGTYTVSFCAMCTAITDAQALEQSDVALANTSAWDTDRSKDTRLACIQR